MTSADRDTLTRFAVGPITAYDVHHAQLAIRRLLVEVAALEQERNNLQNSLAALQEAVHTRLAPVS